MAANEHKNLTDINRHNPKGFENATNNTVLSKNIGTSPTATDGNLVWQNKALMGITNYKMQGFLTGALNYIYGSALPSPQSPFLMDADYGSTSVDVALSPSSLFGIGQGNIIPEIAEVVSVSGWITSSGGNTVTVAICKATPVEGVTTNVTPIVIDEFSVTGLSSSSKLIRVDETAITTSGLADGDILFAMIKEETSGSSIYMNLTIQTTTF